MARRAWWMWLIGLAVAVAALGLGRLKFDPDVLGMLPPEMPEVRGLKAFHDDFARQDELLVLIEGGADDEGLLGEAAADLADRLTTAGLAKRARWQPQWEQDGDAMAELLAYLWLNGPPETAAAQASRFSGANAAPEIAAALERVATAMEGTDMLMRANDPFGFLRHPSLEPLLAMAEEGGAGFESEDGRAHLLLVEAPHALPGYREAAAWLDEVREAVAAWQAADGGNLRIHLTGEPAFMAEIGTAMETDMRGTLGITAGLIGLLFWIVQRRLALLGGLALALGLVFVTALGLAGWIYGELSIMTAGFAAILIGLAVDYGVLICQEGKSAGSDRRALLAATGRSIAWAAATTAVVFLALNFSGLPGIAQLGTMVACGIAAGAVLMLALYLPFVAKVGAARPAPSDRPFPLPRRLGIGLTALLVLAAGGLLAGSGIPGIEFSTDMMRPRDSAAMAGFERVQAQFPQFGSDDLQLVVEAPDDETMHARLDEARDRIAALDGAVASTTFPDGWWPRAGNQQDNRPPLAALAADAPRLLEIAGEAGFSDEGLALGKSVMAALAEMTARDSLPVFPQSDSARDLMRQFIAREPGGGGTALIRINPAESAEPAGRGYETFRRLSGDGIWLTGWSLLRPAVEPLVRQDIDYVFLPMLGLMVVMLGIIFRAWADVMKILAAMALAGLVLLATMTTLGIGWNFLNIAATPLLLGTGIDYGIHVMLALRRNGGDIAAMWHGTGKAVLFCGTSTAIGFGSLCFASNDAMASLGTVAVIGILASMTASVFLLPAWTGKGPK